MRYPFLTLLVVLSFLGKAAAQTRVYKIIIQPNNGDSVYYV